MSRVVRGVAALLGAAIALAVVTARTATTTVPPSKLGSIVRTAPPNDLKPVDCAAITVVWLLARTGTVQGTSQAELILAGPGVDIIDGSAGDDCILAGGGADIIDGGAGYDVCIGGPGIDTYVGCEEEIS